MDLYQYVEKRYLLLKIASSLLALCYSLAYSFDLGVVNRSILTFIFITSLLFATLISSGVGLALRNNQKKLGESETASLLSLVLILLLLGLLLFIVTLSVYSSLKNSLDIKYIILACIVYLSASVSLLLGEFFANRKIFKEWAKLELASVVSQIATYATITWFVSSISSGIKVMISFIFSTIIINTVAFIKLFRTMDNTFRLSSPKKFWKIAKIYNVLTISNVVLDHIDKLIVGFLFPVQMLAPYSIFTALIYFFRFISSYFSKLIVVNEIDFNTANKVRSFRILIINFFTLLLASILSRLVINYTLGNEWTLSLTACLLIALQEFVRSSYALILSSKFLISKRDVIQKAPKIVLYAFFVISIYPVYISSIVGLAMAFTISYLLGVKFLLKESANEK